MATSRTDPMTELELRRQKAKRTALLIGGVVLAIYAMFWLSGVIGR